MCRRRDGGPLEVAHSVGQPTVDIEGQGAPKRFECSEVDRYGALGDGREEPGAEDDSGSPECSLVRLLRTPPKVGLFGDAEAGVMPLAVVAAVEGEGDRRGEEERWTPSFGQFSSKSKVGSGFMIQAASSSGCEEAGRSPGL